MFTIRSFADWLVRSLVRLFAHLFALSIDSPKDQQQPTTNNDQKKKKRKTENQKIKILKNKP